MLAKFYQWLAFAGVVSMLVLASGAKGYLLGAEHQSAVDDKGVQERQQQIYGRFMANTALAASLGTELTDARRDSGTYYGKWQDELLKHKNQLVAPSAAGAAPQPLPVLSNYAVCMWDRANARAGELPGGSAAAADDADAGACASAAAPSGPSGFDLYDALSSHGDDAKDCAFDAQELTELLRFEDGREANAARFKTGAPP